MRGTATATLVARRAPGERGPADPVASPDRPDGVVGHRAAEAQPARSTASRCNKAGDGLAELVEVVLALPRPQPHRDLDDRLRQRPRLRMPLGIEWIGCLRDDVSVPHRVGKGGRVFYRHVHPLHAGDRPWRLSSHLRVNPPPRVGEGAYERLA